MCGVGVSLFEPTDSREARARVWVALSNTPLFRHVMVFSVIFKTRVTLCVEKSMPPKPHKSMPPKHCKLKEVPPMDTARFALVRAPGDMPPDFSVMDQLAEHYASEVPQSCPCGDTPGDDDDDVAPEDELFSESRRGQPSLGDGESDGKFDPVKAQLQTVLIDRDRLKEEIHDLRAQLVRLYKLESGERENWTRSVMNQRVLEQEIMRLKDEVIQAQKSNNDLCKKLADKKHEVSTLKNEQEQMQLRCENEKLKLVCENKKLRLEVEQLEDTEVILKKDQEKLECKNNELKLQISQLEAPEPSLGGGNAAMGSRRLPVWPEPKEAGEKKKRKQQPGS